MKKVKENLVSTASSSKTLFDHIKRQPCVHSLVVEKMKKLAQAASLFASNFMAICGRSERPRGAATELSCPLFARIATLTGYFADFPCPIS
jgi:hypothetical protein